MRSLRANAAPLCDIGTPIKSRVVGPMTAGDNARLAGLLRPGDVVMESNDRGIGGAFFDLLVPGNWVHVMLHLGTPEAIARDFDADPEVIAWVRTVADEQPSLAGVTRFTELLARAYPDAWTALQHPNASHGVNLEGIGDGVSLTSWSSTSSAHIAVLRNATGRLNNAKALFYSLAQLGKPYDLGASWASENALTCSELIGKALAPSKIHFPQREIYFARNVAPDDVVRYYAEHAEDMRPKLSFVAFAEADVPGRDMQSQQAERDFRRSFDARLSQ